MSADPPVVDDQEEPGSIRTRSDFARQLTRLRVDANLTVRQVAARAGAFGAHTTIGDWFAGRGLPSPASEELLVRVLSACGVTDTESVASWLAAWQRVRRSSGRRADDRSPYRGLASFQPEDVDWFFGRGDLLQQLIGRLSALRAAGGGIQVVVGASGSGKSSLLRAGVVPAVRSGALGPLSVELITPGPHPLTGLAGVRRGGDLVLVVDQFEEVFTACTDQHERRVFIAQLGALTVGPEGALVVIGLRADFYSQALSQPELFAALRDGQFTVGPMDEAHLRQVIVEPAAKALVEVEDGLVEILVRDVGAASTAPAGMLPLLSHALYATWSRGMGRRMTIAAYRDLGGVEQAVAASADAVLASLTDTQRDLARQLLISLVRVAPDTADTRRRAEIDELTAGHGANAGELRQVLDRFVAQRLITVDATSAEISHEALLTAWPSLRGWLDTDRAGLVLGEQLRSAAAAWRTNRHDPALLYRGARLAAAQEWVTTRPELPASVVEFVKASTRHARSRSRQVYQIFATLITLLLVSCLLAGYAFQQRATAADERRAAETQRNQALSRLVATHADQLRISDPPLARQLGLAAYRISPTMEARSSLLSSSSSPPVTRLVASPSAVQSVTYSPDHRILAAACVDHTVRLWDTADPTAVPVTLTAPLTGSDGYVFTTAFSPDGRLLAAAGADATVHLWDLGDPRNPLPVRQPLTGPRSTVYEVAFSPDGHVLAAASADGAVYRWDLSDPARSPPLPTLVGSGAAVQSVAFSPHGDVLAAGSADGTVTLWHTDRAELFGTLQTGGQFKVLSVAFSPDGRTLAGAGGDKLIHLWNVADPTRPVMRPQPLSGPTSWVNSVQFSPDGASIAAGSSDKTLRIWDVATGRGTATLSQPAPLTSVSYGRDDHGITTASTDGTVRLWTVPGPVLSGHDDAVFTAVFSPDGMTLATASRDETVRLWKVRNPQQPAPLGPVLHSPADGAAFDGTTAFSPDAKTLAIGTRTGPVQLWNVADPLHPGLQREPLTGPRGLVEAIAFSADGRLLAAGSDDGNVYLWNLADPAISSPTATMRGTADLILSVAFSPDSRTVAATSTDGTARQWDVTRPATPAPLGAPLDGFSGYAYSAAFSPSGRTLAVSSADRTVRLWDLADRDHPRPLGAPLTGPTSYAYSVAFSPDGSKLAVASTDNTIWIWDITDPRRPVAWATLTGAADALYTVQFSPDGTTLAAGGADNTVRFWDTDIDRVAARTCATSGDPISNAEWDQYAPGAPYTPPCR